MGLSRKTATQILLAVNKDSVSRTRIQSGADSSGAGSIFEDYFSRGAIRNFEGAGWSKLAGDIGGPKWGNDDFVCSGIAKATAKAIEDAKIPGVRSARAWPDSIKDNRHWATLVNLDDGSSYVFDWWVNLSVQRPLIYTRANWDAGRHGGVEFAHFAGSEEAPAKPVAKK